MSEVAKNRIHLSVKVRLQGMVSTIIIFDHPIHRFIPLGVGLLLLTCFRRHFLRVEEILAGLYKAGKKVLQFHYPLLHYSTLEVSAV